MICIIDYGIGNLRSMEKALVAVGADVLRSDRPADLDAADRLVLPGVGAFGACIAEIERRGLVGPIQEQVAAGKPLLGVCVGMQLLFDLSEERGQHSGLGLLPGRVVRFREVPVLEPVAAYAGDPPPPPYSPLKIPHMGWNVLHAHADDPLLDGLPPEPYVYFVHSYHAVPEEPSDVLASTPYGLDFPSIVRRNNVYGVQFHPEKSQRNGLRLLHNFAHRVG